MVGAEEVETAGEAGPAAEHGGVAIEVVEIVEVRPFERRQYLRIILVRRARAEHLEAGSHASIVIGDHAAEVVRHDLDAGMAVKQTGEYQPRHRYGRVI